MKAPSHFQTVVVGVDFSKYSKIVVRQAIELAKTQQANLVLVYTLTNLALTTSEIELDFATDFVKPLTKEITSFYKLKAAAPTARVVVNLGRPCDGIIDVAKEVPFPIIVVGHKGKSTFVGRLFIGSTAEQLALHSSFPVWIHRGNKVRRPKKILVPCDFSSRTMNSFDLVKSLNGTSKSKYEFFHVLEQPVPILDARQWKEVMDRLRQKDSLQQKTFRSQFPKISFVRREGDPASQIFKESRKFDLIAMAPHNREGLFSGFGSVTTKVVRQGHTPVLITH